MAENTAVSLPDLRGRSLAQAKKELTGLGLDVGGIEFRITSDHPPGAVLDQRPASGQKVESGSKVKLVVSDKPDVLVPLVAQMPLSEAKLALEKVDLVPGEVKTMGYMTRPSSEPVVRRQSIGSGTRVKAGSRVDLIVAGLGAQVPDLTGLQLEEARIELEKRGLTLGSVKEQLDSTTTPGAVVSQAEGRGRWVAKGKSIDLVVASKPASRSSMNRPPAP